MAISLGFGVLVATFFTLLMIPAAMVIVEDLKEAWALGIRQLASIYGDFDESEAS
jgi:hypothetical protein